MSDEIQEELTATDLPFGSSPIGEDGEIEEEVVDEDDAVVDTDVDISTTDIVDPLAPSIENSFIKQDDEAEILLDPNEDSLDDEFAR